MSSMAYNSAAGLGGMLKAGTRHFSQQDDEFSGSVVLRNIEACLQLSRMLSTSLGPQGRCKLVVNHLGKLNVTSDCASILKDVEVEHPAARLLQQACEKQETECGDQTNFVMAVAGELLWQTARLIGKMTWQPAPEILAGYALALKLVETEFLPQLTAETIEWNLNNDNDSNNSKQQLLKILRPVLASKQFGSETILEPLVAEACLSVLRNSSNNNLNVDAIRTIKIPGGSITQSTWIAGYVTQSSMITVQHSLTKDRSSSSDSSSYKIAVYACGLEASSTEAKGTVLMKTADDLLNYNLTEEKKMQEIIQGITDAGVDCVVTGGNVSDMALHFMDRRGLLCLRLGSKWELRRLCQAVGATALVRLGAPTPDEMGHAQTIQQQEIGGTRCTVFQVGADSKLATIVLRAGTRTVLHDLERAVDDGVRCVAQALQSSSNNRRPPCRLVYGGGAVEMALAVRLDQAATQQAGLEQYALQAMARALEAIPRILAENAGRDPVQTLANLRARHAQNLQEQQGASATVCDAGVDIDLGWQNRNPAAAAATSSSSSSTVGITSMKDKGVVDLVSTKLSALRLAVDAVITILKIDQIIMSKPAGVGQG